jgi:hypothetical protein
MLLILYVLVPQVVGVDTENGWWKVRNNWSTAWGDEGHIYLQYGQNTCQIANDPTVTKVSRPSGSS